MYINIGSVIKYWPRDGYQGMALNMAVEAIGEVMGKRGNALLVAATHHAPENQWHWVDAADVTKVLGEKDA